MSFEESSILLNQLAAVTVGPKQVERHAEALGREVAADEKQEIAPMEQTPLPPTLYLGMDGTGHSHSRLRANGPFWQTGRWHGQDTGSKTLHHLERRGP